MKQMKPQELMDKYIYCCHPVHLVRWDKNVPCIGKKVEYVAPLRIKAAKNNALQAEQNAL